MKKIFISLFALLGVLSATATEANDTTAMTTLSDIIAMESQSQINNDNSSRLRSLWGKNTYLNISYNTTKLSSKEFPTAVSPFKLENEFKNKFGVGLQWGQTFNFHKKPLGNVLFLGLDYTWMDLNFNQYDADSVPKQYEMGDGQLNMPWHQKKMTLNYGMSVGPSLTLYPFIPTHNARAEKVRLQFYFHVGYSVGGAFIKDVMDKSGDKKNRIAWGHGLYTSYGANLTWNFIGLGFEWRNDNSINYKCVNKEFGTEKMKAKEKTSRVYLQFRF